MSKKNKKNKHIVTFKQKFDFFDSVDYIDSDEKFKKFYDDEKKNFIHKYSELDVFYYFFNKNELNKAEYIYTKIKNTINLAEQLDLLQITNNKNICVNIFIDTFKSKNIEKIIWICELHQKYNNLKHLTKSIKTNKSDMPMFDALINSIDQPDLEIFSYVQKFMKDNCDYFKSNIMVQCYLTIFRNYIKSSNDLYNDNLINAITTNDKYEQNYYKIFYNLLSVPSFDSEREKKILNLAKITVQNIGIDVFTRFLYTNQENTLIEMILELDDFNGINVLTNILTKNEMDRILTNAEHFLYQKFYTYKEVYSFVKYIKDKLNVHKLLQPLKIIVNDYSMKRPSENRNVNQTNLNNLDTHIKSIIANLELNNDQKENIGIRLLNHCNWLLSLSHNLAKDCGIIIIDSFNISDEIACKNKIDLGKFYNIEESISRCIEILNNFGKIETKKKLILDIMFDTRLKIEKSEENSCPICMEDNNISVKTNCGHYFCYMCLLNHIKTNKTHPCPMCRSKLIYHKFCNIKN